MIAPMQGDPDGVYARLGVDPSASAEEIAAAYRRAARRLHPDIPVTGDAAAFLALKSAYDVLADPLARRAYDRAARVPPTQGARPAAPRDTSRPGPRVETPPAPPRAAPSSRRFGLWAGFLVASAVGAAWLMVAIASGPTAGLPDRAGTPRAARGWPTAAKLPRALPAGTANHFVLPGLGPATVWRQDAPGAPLRALATLGEFTAVDVLGMDPSRRLAAIRLDGGTIGFVAAARLIAGGKRAARRAFCADRAGLPPRPGEVLVQRGSGRGSITVRNDDLEPAVVKLRDRAGQVVRALYLAPGESRELRALPGRAWQVDFAAGELWSRVCATFAAGERAQRFRFPVGSGSILVVPPDLPAPAMPVDIPDRVFARP